MNEYQPDHCDRCGKLPAEPYDTYLCDQCGEYVCIDCLRVPGSDNNESVCVDCPAMGPTPEDDREDAETESERAERLAGMAEEQGEER